MSKTAAILTEQYLYTQNRELSWLKFNQRVLEEAADTNTPLLERLKFIAIFSSNLDEFFMVRVGSLFDVSLISPEDIDNKSGLSPLEQLQKIYAAIPGLIELKKALYHTVQQALQTENIFDLSYEELAGEEKKYIHKFFKAEISPIISPMIIGSHHPFPHLDNKSLYIASFLKDKKGKTSIGLIPVPQTLPKYIVISDEPLRFIRLENIILGLASSLFGSYQAEESCIISVTRNADISFDEDKFDDHEEDFRTHMVKLLKKRKYLSVVRLEINQKISENFLSTLSSLIHVEKRQIYFDPCPLNMKYAYQLEAILPAPKAQRLIYQPYTPRWPEDIDVSYGIIEQVKQKDKLLFYPYDSVEPFLRLLSEAAERDDVLSIKITIYRLASSSKIARTLCRAAENGKEVIVLMELRARFDEANNISWSKLLEDAGCQVIYGLEDFKCHSKICLITLREKNQLSYITQIGTGNYNEKTNTMYTDLSIITSSQAIGEDSTAFFKNLLINNLSYDYQKLLVAPYSLKNTLCRLIDEQIALADQGLICIKANSITEREVIDKLREASQAGVKIELIIRGICCLLPQVPSYTENIQVSSIVGRYLEHARIYCFGSGANAKYYISSADLMTRNLNRRLEIACPIEDRNLCEKLKWILDTQLKDNAKASYLLPDGSYLRKNTQSSLSFDSQMQFMQSSFHQQETFIPAKENLSAKLLHIFHKIF